MVIDSHTHAWGPSVEAHPWVNDELIAVARERPTATTYTAEELLSDTRDMGIDRAVIVGYPITDWRDNWYVHKAVIEHDELNGVVLLDPFAEDATMKLRESMAIDGILGFRLGVIHEYDAMWSQESPKANWLLDAIDKTDFWETVRQTNAIVQLLVHYDQLNQVLELVQEYPDLTYIVDHLARVDPEHSPDEGGFATFADLAEFDTVLTKVSALPFLSNEGFPYKDLHGHLAWLLDAFEANRLLWGSDYQFESNLATYEQTLEWMKDAECLSRTDIKWLTERTFKHRLM